MNKLQYLEGFIYLFIFSLLIKCGSCAVEENPWEKHTSYFDIPKNHRSGVFQDLTGELINGLGEVYGFPKGACPVFSKKVVLANNIEEIVVKKLTSEMFWENSIRRDVLKVLYFPQVNEENDFRKFKSPVKKQNISDCAKYAATMEFYTASLTPDQECLDIKPGEAISCTRQPFMYNLKTKECTIYFHHSQDVANIVHSTKQVDENHIELVFGTYKIKDDWIKNCPSKPIKGAIFGKWINGKCVQIVEIGDETTAESCAEKLYFMSPNDNESRSYGKGYNWGYHLNNKCIMIESTTPDCLIYKKDAYSFFSTSMASTDIYDLPPCIEESEGWIIEANCIDDKNRLYTCKNRMWTSENDNFSIITCDSNQPWANFYEETNSSYRASAAGGLIIAISLFISFFLI